MEKEQLKDDFLGNLLKRTQSEKPTVDFTPRIMSNIWQLEDEKARSQLWNWKNLVLMLSGFILITAIYFVISPFLGEFNFVNQGIDPERFGDYLDFFLDSFQGFLSIIEFLKESTIFLIILLVIPLLLIIDRLLKRFSSRTYLFLL